MATCMVSGIWNSAALMLITFVAYWVIGFCSGWYLAYLRDEPLGAAGFWIGLIIGLTAAAVALITRLRIVGQRHIRAAQTAAA